jgi:hypothetical protein
VWLSFFNEGLAKFTDCSCDLCIFQCPYKTNLVVTLKQTGIALLATFALVGLPIVARATDWTLVETSENGARYFVDLDSIVRSGNFVKASIFVVYGTSTSDGTVGYTGIREFSCLDKKTRDIQTTFLSEDGSSLRAGGDEWRDNLPGTLGESANTKVCTY